MRLNKSSLILASQSGVGLVALMIAAALVVVIALTVSNFLTSQHRTSAILENSSLCQQIAKNTVDYFLLEDNSLFYYSHGPQRSSGGGFLPGNLGDFNNVPNTVVTTDGFPQFPNNLPSVENPSNQSFINQAPNSSSRLTDWFFHNSFNIKNSFNRLAAITAARNLCCDDIDNFDACNPVTVFRNVGTPVSLSGLNITEEGIRVDMVVNFKNGNNSICSGNSMDMTNLPNPSKDSSAEFAVRVYSRLDQGGNIIPNQTRFCEAKSRVSYPSDTFSPLTILEIQDGNLCANPKQGTPSICATTESVQVLVATYADEVNCRTNFDGQENRSCRDTFNNPTGGPLNNHGAPNCRLSDPGSMFLCRIGEKRWFERNPNYWEPCHLAQIWRCTDDACNTGSFTAVGDVAIDYTVPQNISGITRAGNGQTEITTQAMITLSNFNPGFNAQAYMVDVRAVDASGNMGASFCSYADQCDGTGDTPHFVLLQGSPTLGNLNDTSGFTGNSGSGLQGQRAEPVAGIYSRFPGNYQCSAGFVSISSTVSYGLPSFVSSDIYSETCTADLTIGASTTNNAATCSCSSGICRFVSSINTPNNYSVQMDVSNDCNTTGIPAPAPYAWCFENSNSPNVAAGSVTQASSPIVNWPGNSAAKICGVVSAMGSVAGGVGAYSAINGGFNSPIPGWNAILHSGCLREPITNPQFCVRSSDVCGNSVDSSTVYSTQLVGDMSATNSCRVAGPFQVGGNSCESGYCTSGSGGGFKCQTNCPVSATACRDNSDCDHPSFCPGTSGSCNGYSRRCQAGAYTENQSCTVGSACSVFLGSCRGICSHNPFLPCSGNSDCGAGNTCNSKVCGGTSNTCTDNSDCSIAGTCQETMGTCSCPSNTNCSECPHDGNLNFCPTISVCGGPSGHSQNSSCSGTPPAVSCQNIYSSWSGCQACGTSGTETRTLIGCRDINTGAACGSCSAPAPSDLSRSCTPANTNCSPRWVQVGWGPCECDIYGDPHYCSSVGNCGSIQNTEEMQYQCQDSTGAVVADNLCPQPKPFQSRFCTTPTNTCPPVANCSGPNRPCGRTGEGATCYCP